VIGQVEIVHYTEVSSDNTETHCVPLWGVKLLNYSLQVKDKPEGEEGTK
jgi:hypothetical protein